MLSWASSIAPARSTGSTHGACHSASSCSRSGGRRSFLSLDSSHAYRKRETMGARHELTLAPFVPERRLNLGSKQAAVLEPVVFVVPNERDVPYRSFHVSGRKVWR